MLGIRDLVGLRGVSTHRRDESPHAVVGSRYQKWSLNAHVLDTRLHPADKG